MQLAVLFTVLAMCAVGCSGVKYCSYEDTEDVLTNWNGMMAGGNTAPYMLAIFKEVFKRMIDHHNETTELFNRVNANGKFNSPEYEAHVLRVANAFDDVLNKLHNHRVVDHMLDHLAKAHVKRTGLTKEYFKFISTELYDVLEVSLDHYNPDAWSNCVGGILDGISISLPDK